MPIQITILGNIQLLNEIFTKQRQSPTEMVDGIIDMLYRDLQKLTSDELDDLRLNLKSKPLDEFISSIPPQYENQLIECIRIMKGN